MEKFILKSTGGSAIPFYLTPAGNFTAHHTEAQQFDTIDAAKAAVTDGRCYQIQNAETLKWVAWVNY
jgi:hypothetical protein